MYNICRLDNLVPTAIITQKLDLTMSIMVRVNIKMQALVNAVMKTLEEVITDSAVMVVVNLVVKGKDLDNKDLKDLVIMVSKVVMDTTFR